MIDKKYIELMNRSIDNLISDEEKIRLDYYLAENREAKGYYEELLLTTKYLNEMQDPVPSAHLKNHIVNSINFSRYSGKSIRSHRNYFSSIFNFKYAVSFAVGLLAGIFIYSLFALKSDNISMEEVSGTIATTENAVTIEDIPLNFPGIKGRIEMKVHGQNFWFNISSNSSMPVDFMISYPDQVQLENVKPGHTSDFSLSSGENYVKTTVKGSQSYKIMFRSNALTESPIQLKLLQSGITIDNLEFSLKR